MNLYEYVVNITANGSRIILPDFTASERRETIGEPGNNITTIMWIVDKNKRERQKEREDTGKQLRKVEDILSKISEAAVICSTPQQFYRKCFSHCPLDVRNGEYDEAKWLVLQEDIVNEVMAHFMRRSYIERQSNSAKFLYSVMKDRIDTFKKNATVNVDKGGEDDLNVTINIH